VSVFKEVSLVLFVENVPVLGRVLLQFVLEELLDLLSVLSNLLLSLSFLLGVKIVELDLVV